jgi:putative hydrolase of the HAD superfamily
MIWSKRAIFFDAGFTLLEPVRPVADVYLSAAEILGVALPVEPFRERLGRLWAQLNRRYRSAAEDLRSSEAIERDAWRSFTFELARPYPELLRIHAEWLARLFDYFDGPQAWRPAAGATELLETLKANGATIGVISNWHQALHGILADHGLARHLDFVLTSAEVGYKKPHRRIFEAGLEQSGCLPHQAVHIGDSWAEDVAGACALGMQSVYVSRGGAPPAPTNGEKALVVANLADLLP